MKAMARLREGDFVPSIRHSSAGVVGRSRIRPVALTVWLGLLVMGSAANAQAVAIPMALGGMPQAPSPPESDTLAKAVDPAELKVGRTHAIIGQWHGSSYGGSEFHEFSVVKIYSARRWRDFWHTYLKWEQPANFDDSLHQAVYIELGVRPTSGYSVEVVSAYEVDKNLVLEYMEREPARDQYVMQALTTPWVMVLLPRTDLRVVTRQAPVTREE